MKTFWVKNDSMIAGKVVDHLGRSASFLTIELIPWQKKRGDVGFDWKWAVASEDGRFDFKGVPPGRYLLSLNYTDKPEEDSPYPTVFFPLTYERAQAKIIEIEMGSKHKDLVFRVPKKLIKRPLSGTVVWRDGKPAVGAEVQLVDVAFDRDVFFTAPLTDESGKFKVEWFGGRTYKIKVIVWEKAADGSGVGVADAETKEFVLNDKMGSVQIVLDSIDPRTKAIRGLTVRAN